MGALTPARLALRTLFKGNEHQPYSGQVSLFHTARPSMHSVPNHLALPTHPFFSLLPAQGEMAAHFQDHWTQAWTSPFPRRLVASPGRIGFAFATDCMFASGCSPPRLTTTQLPSATRDGHSLGGDLHPSGHACLQAHWERRPAAILTNSPASRKNVGPTRTRSYQNITAGFRLPSPRRQIIHRLQLEFIN